MKRWRLVGAATIVAGSVTVLLAAALPSGPAPLVAAAVLALGLVVVLRLQGTAPGLVAAAPAAVAERAAARAEAAAWVPPLTVSRRIRR